MAKIVLYSKSYISYSFIFEAYTLLLIAML